MIREYETHRIPDESVVDWEVEYLSYCDRCKKDLIVPKDIPKMRFLCKSCREQVLIETGQAPKSVIEGVSHDEIIMSKRKPISVATRDFSRAMLAFLLAIIALIVAATLEITKSESYSSTIWSVFGVLSLVTIFFMVKAVLAKMSEKEK